MKEILNKAVEIAIDAHKNQLDKNGETYIFHVMRVGLRGKNDEEKITGILHDVVEDSNYTFEYLKNAGIPETILDALKCLTKTSEHEPYEEFINRIKKNPLAIRVKLNDLEDNMDVKRLTKIGENESKRLSKYLKAYEELRNLL